VNHLAVADFASFDSLFIGRADASELAFSLGRKAIALRGNLVVQMINRIIAQSALEFSRRFPRE